MVKNRECIESLTPYVPGKPVEDVKREYGLLNVVKLASNENPYGSSSYAAEAGRKALDDIFYYPDGSCIELRELLAEKLSIKEKQLVFGTGADELISLLSQTFIETGDEAVTGEITFGQYAAGVRAMGGIVKYVPMKDGAYDLEGVLATITDKTKIIFIANPNNPTGTIINEREKIEFLNKVRDGILVVFDEAYAEFVESTEYESSVPLIEKYENLAVLKTFSKIYGLASLRIGYCIMNETHARYMEKIRLPFNVCLPAQKAAAAALKDTDFISSVYQKNSEAKRFCYKALDEMGLSYFKSEANFIMAYVGADSISVFEALMKKGYIVRPGKPFGMPSHLRITLGTMEQMRGFFKALREILA